MKMKQLHISLDYFLASSSRTVHRKLRRLSRETHYNFRCLVGDFHSRSNFLFTQKRAVLVNGCTILGRVTSSQRIVVFYTHLAMKEKMLLG
jgi:hypothetical protein